MTQGNLVFSFEIKAAAGDVRVTVIAAARGRYISAKMDFEGLFNPGVCLAVSGSLGALRAIFNDLRLSFRNHIASVAAMGSAPD
jgi:hypothetical protein